MGPNEVLSDVSKICREVFNDQQLEISPNTRAKDVAGWDSMTNLFLIDAIEQRFKFKFTLDEIMNAGNVGELCGIVMQRGQLS
ncbi:MAG TPA: acyl carrier protein [Puia sp.]|jgi:acyl carrier protein|nr:acyl carrier protein [Puia sp.]